MTQTYKVKYILPESTEEIVAILEDMDDASIAKWEQICDRHAVKIISIEPMNKNDASLYKTRSQ